jgi:hypothetical protein
MPLELLREGHHCCSHASHGGEFASEKSTARYAPVGPLEPTHIQCDLNVNILEKKVHAKVKYRSIVRKFEQNFRL